MSRNGSGIYSLPAGNPVVTGTVISSSWANTTLTDIANTLTQSLSADGQTPITGNINFNGNQTTGLASATVAGNAVEYSQFQTPTFTGNVSITSTGFLLVPVGTTAQRPGTPAVGEIRYNSDLGSFEGYANGAWGQLGGGATGGGNDQVFVENGVEVTTSYTFPTGKNAMSVGPITIDASATVTIPSASRWVIL
jgi:hypothetical protein